MQFKRRMMEKVIAGTKTHTFRLKEPRYKVGSIQPVQCGYRDKAHGHVRIISIEPKRVGDHDLVDVLAEGFPGFDEFFDYLQEIHQGKQLIARDTEGWSIGFKLFKDARTVKP